jgi:lysophospholipase L1-like esterase
MSAFRTHRYGWTVVALLIAAGAALLVGWTTAKAGTVRCSAPAIGPERAGSGLPQTLAVKEIHDRSGCIGLLVTGAQATSVTIAEMVPGQEPPIPLGSAVVRAGTAVVANIPWICERSTRTFQITESLADGTSQSANTTVTTPSCGQRLTARLQDSRAHSGFPVTIRVADRWHLGGLRLHACLRVAGPPDCSGASLPAGDASTLLRLRAHGQGQVRVTIKDGYQTANLSVHVLASRPVMLATGDSEMQVLDELLANDLGGEGVHVTGDARQSTAISSPSFFDWPAHAFAQVAGQHPDIVAMFLGGNEGFRLGDAECCGAGWSREYATRVEGMMHAYRQNGAAAVYWFLIPTPSREPFVRVVRAVDEGIEIAAAHAGEGVHVFDLRPVFSPGGRYINMLTREGQTITVHEADGFHLSASADRIVARMFIARLHQDGVL